MTTKRLCQYTKIHSNGYGATWKTSCRKTKQYASDIEVGFSFPPLPTEYTPYCGYCGNLISLKGE